MCEVYRDDFATTIGVISSTHRTLAGANEMVGLFDRRMLILLKRTVCLTRVQQDVCNQKMVKKLSSVSLDFGAKMLHRVYNFTLFK